MNLRPPPPSLVKTDMPGEGIGPASSWAGVSNADWDPPSSTGGIRDGSRPPTVQTEVLSPIVAGTTNQVLRQRIPNPSPNARDAAWAADCRYQYVDLCAGPGGPDCIPSSTLAPLRDAVLAARQVDRQLVFGGSHVRGPEYNSEPVSTPQGADAQPYSRVGPQATEPFTPPGPRPAGPRAPRGTFD